MSKPKNDGVSLTIDDVEKLSVPLEQALAIVYCAMDYACGDTHAPYLKPALTSAVDLLSGVNLNMKNLLEEAYNATAKAYKAATE